MAQGSFSLWQLGKWFGFGQSEALDRGIRALRNGEVVEAVVAFRESSAQRDPAVKDASKRLLLDSLVSAAESATDEDAAGYWKEATDIFPNYPDLRVGYARALAKLKEADLAMEQVDEALERNPRYREARLLKAYIHGLRREWEHAFAEAELALQAPTLEQREQLEFAKRCVDNFDLGRALKNLEEIAEPAQSPISDAMHLAMDRRFLEASASYRALVEAHPHFPDLRCHYAQVLMELEQDDEAQEQLEEAIKLNPRYAEAHAQLGIALRRMGHNQDAVQHFNQALDIDRNHPIARLELSRLPKL